MKAILIKSPGGPEQLYVGEYETPQPGPTEILVRVVATAVNRADTLQRQGKYPVPAGSSPILGLEMAGEVVAIGSEVSRWQPGDQVCGLLGGGGHAEYAAIHQDLALPLPAGMDYVQAAAIPEVFLTAYQALIWLGALQPGERVLIHAGASGVGTAAIQIAREQGAEVFVTASAGKHALCLDLGASMAIDYRKQDFSQAVKAEADLGVDLILDVIAAPYFQANLDLLQTDGRLVMLALLGGVHPDRVNLAPILRKRLQITGSTLRNRSLDYKIRLSQALQAFAWPRFQAGTLRPVIDRVLPWTDIVAAHRAIEANENAGKIVLTID
jgi:putative PIG3 family NAD(P)H quinone oxidoreductase